MHSTGRALAIATAALLTGGTLRAQDYRVDQVAVGAATEYQCSRSGHHFLTIIDEGGTFAIRPHPGEDANGWGSTLYLQPFLPGATLGHTSIAGVMALPDRVEITVSGFVSRGVADAYGTWAVQMSFEFDATAKRVLGTGSYSISLQDVLAGVGDLNLLKIASNYLDNVPLLIGGIGDTGDMREVHVNRNGPTAIWHPAEQPAYFPQDLTDSLSINASGELNNIDTAAQGYVRIAPAYKPSLSVALISNQDGIPMIFGAIYNVSQSQQFFADNVGITPLILSRASETQFSFTVGFGSGALPGDGKDRDFDGVLDAADNCPEDINSSQVDADSDGTGDVCDGCPSDPQKIEPGRCGCGAAETDSDSDGTADCADECPGDPAKAKAGQCGCGTPDTDSDQDGVADCRDACPRDPAKTADTDSDSDGTLDCNDGCPNDGNKTAPGQCGCGQPDVDDCGGAATDQSGSSDQVPSQQNDGVAGQTPVTSICGAGILESVLLMGSGLTLLSRARCRRGLPKQPVAQGRKTESTTARVHLAEHGAQKAE